MHLSVPPPAPPPTWLADMRFSSMPLCANGGRPPNKPADGFRPGVVAPQSPVPGTCFARKAEAPLCPCNKFCADRDAGAELGDPTCRRALLPDDVRLALCVRQGAAGIPSWTWFITGDNGVLMHFSPPTQPPPHALFMGTMFSSFPLSTNGGRPPGRPPEGCRPGVVGPLSCFVSGCLVRKEGVALCPRGRLCCGG